VQGIAVSQGVFSGLVTNASTGGGIAGASVAIRRTSDNVVVHTATTAANGSWTSVALPAGTYSLAVSANGYTSANVAGITLVGGPNNPVTTVATVALAPSGAVISGTVRDATNNQPVPTASVELRAGVNNVSGTPISTVTSTATGTFSFPSQPSGQYTVRVQKTGFADGIANVSVSGSIADSPTIFLSPATAGAWRFVLQWGSRPFDLDAHLTGPIQQSQSRFHVYFGDPGSLTSSPFAQLDFDQVDGFGPETMTIGQQFTGTYRFYVHNYSGEFNGDTQFSGSNARVSVYQSNALVATYSVPAQAGFYWTVFEITNGTLIPINTVGNTTPSLVSPLVGPRNSPAARAAAAAEEWYNLAPWSWQGLKKPR
jgi:uncharacterized protein YfaP (DUF2135 family)